MDCQFLTEAFDICKEGDFTGLPGKCEKCKEFHLNQYRVRQLNRFGLFIQLNNKVVRIVYKTIKLLNADATMCIMRVLIVSAKVRRVSVTASSSSSGEK